MIKSSIVAHSINVQGDKIASVLCTVDTNTLNELLANHKEFSITYSDIKKIKFNELLKQVLENPFIPIAWQKDHNGIQGTKYFTDLDKASVVDGHYPDSLRELQRNWLKARDEAIKQAKRLNSLGLTKQLCNRLLEPFMWTTVLITGSIECWDNFFKLRCGNYGFTIDGNYHEFKSKNELLKSKWGHLYSDNTDLQWLKMNKGQAEIHMMALAECIYDAVNESTPKQLKAGEWHIPFEDKIQLAYSDYDSNGIVTKEGLLNKVKIATAMAVYNSYTIIGDEPVKSSKEWQDIYPEIKVLDPDGWNRQDFENSWNEKISFEEYQNRLMRSTCKGINNFPLVKKHTSEKSYEKWIELHDKLISQNPPHSNPMEHCAKAMSYNEYVRFLKGEGDPETEYYKGFGWCNNFRGFIQYRYLIDNRLI